jgi:inhibitor of KinA
MTTAPPTPHIEPVGDGAVIATFSTAPEAPLAMRCLAAAESLRRTAPGWVTDVVPALASVTVHFRAASAGEAAERRQGCATLLAEALARTGEASNAPPGRAVEIPVCYGQTHAPDLAWVAETSGLAVEAVIRAHTGTDLPVLMIGFAPGTPYLGGLDPRLMLPRRATPRPRVEAGSVAIANGQCVIYPRATPGGWHVIGRTPLRLFDARRDPPNLLNAGDVVRFVPITDAGFDALAGRA